MKKLPLYLVMICGLSGCNFLKVKVSPDPFYSAVLIQDSNNEAALYAQGERFIRQGRYGDAIKYFVQLTKSEPGNANAWFILGRSYYEIQDYGKARSAFEKALELQPSESALLGKAAATLMEGNIEDARQLADQSEKQYGAGAALYQVKGDLAFFTKDPAGALKYYKQSLEKNPQQGEIQARVQDLEEYLSISR